MRVREYCRILGPHSGSPFGPWGPQLCHLKWVCPHGHVPGRRALETVAEMIGMRPLLRFPSTQRVLPTQEPKKILFSARLRIRTARSAQLSGSMVKEQEAPSPGLALYKPCHPREVIQTLWTSVALPVKQEYSYLAGLFKSKISTKGAKSRCCRAKHLRYFMWVTNSTFGHCFDKRYLTVPSIPMELPFQECKL